MSEAAACGASQANELDVSSVESAEGLHAGGTTTAEALVAHVGKTKVFTETKSLSYLPPFYSLKLRFN